ncbi:MAG: RnfABCDGE type electron transport complex subunit G [Prevotellaceae bacterium]|jgi:electron transport complex protein RnfG|nr:RnfABCDGE type electron transport complex subunit G [Prevotellaceae bacterium]
MKKLESSLLNMLFVLTFVTVIAVGLLAVVNEVTREPIAAAAMRTLNEALKQVVPAFTNNPVAEADTLENGFIVYPAMDGEQSVGTAVEATAMGFGGELRVLVGFDAAGNIYNYSLLAHAETPGLGSKADVWFKEGGRGSIIGKNPGAETLSVAKDGGTVDAITASTITSRAFLKAVNEAYQAYHGNVDAATGASSQATATQQSDAHTAASAQQH